MTIKGEELQEVLEALRRIAAIAAADAMDPYLSPEPPPHRHEGGDADPTKLLDLARSRYQQRRRREEVFGRHADIFSDPAWDIMLDLFICARREGRISVSSACIASCAPPTTALRWISLLERRELIRRRADLDDRRRTFLELTTEGDALVAAALAKR